MALRSLGSTLLAKAGSGTQLRSAEEARKEGVVSRQSAVAQPTSVVRKTTDEPLEKPTPEGTEKLVSVQPVMEGRVSTNSQANQGILPQMGGASAAVAGNMPVAKLGINAGVPTSRSQSGGDASSNVAAGKPISSPQSFSQPTAAMGQTPKSSGLNLQTQIKNQFGGFLTPGEITNYAQTASKGGDSVKADVSKPSFTPSNTNPLFGWLTGAGNTVSADELAKPTNVEFNRNLLQGISKVVQQVIDSVGGATGNIFPEGNVSEFLGQRADTPSNLGLFANLSGSQNASKSPYVQQASNAVKQSVAKASSAAKNVANKVSSTASNLRSQASNVVNNVKNTVSNAANKASSFLRSLFGK